LQCQKAMEQGPKVKAPAQAGDWDLAAPGRNAAGAADAAQDKARAKDKGKAKDRAKDRAADKAEAAGKTGRIIL